MSCIVTDTMNLSEFEFYQELLRLRGTDLCAGNLVRVEITSPYFGRLLSVLDHLGKTSDYIDTVDVLMLDSSHLSLNICSRHWVNLIQDLGDFAMAENDQVLLQLLFYLYRVICMHNSWDHKEIINYLKTYGKMDPI